MLYYLDSDQLGTLIRVKKRLYDEMTRLGADERRDLANAMDAVLHNVETYGIANEPDPPPVAQHDWEFYMNGSFCKKCGAAMGSGVPCVETR